MTDNTQKLDRAFFERFARVFDANLGQTFQTKLLSANLDRGFILLEATLADGEVTETGPVMLHASSFERVPDGADEATKAAVFARTRAALEEFLTGDLNVTPVSVTQRTHGGTKHRFPVQRAA